MTPILIADRVSKTYGARRALVGASFELHAGEVVAVLGHSGSGKTTLFRCLTRLVEPDAGDIIVDGLSLIGLRGRSLAGARRKIGVVFQQFNLVRRLSAVDNVLAGRLADAPLWRVLSRSFGERDERLALHALEMVGLGGHSLQRADTLSGGQQQRVAIARAIAQESRILLADEPVASLDPETAAAILEILRTLARSKGMAVLCTLHQPELASRFADRLLYMNEGHLRDRREGDDARCQTEASDRSVPR